MLTQSFLKLILTEEFFSLLNDIDMSPDMRHSLFFEVTPSVFSKPLCYLIRHANNDSIGRSCGPFPEHSHFIHFWGSFFIGSFFLVNFA